MNKVTGDERSYIEDIELYKTSMLKESVLAKKLLNTASVLEVSFYNLIQSKLVVDKSRNQM